MPPLPRLLLQNRRYAGQGGDAEHAEPEHFLFNNLKSCRVEAGGRGMGRCRGFGCGPEDMGSNAKCQITMSAQGM